MYSSVVWCSGGCSWKCYTTLTFCSLWTRCTIPCACHAKRHLNLQKWREHVVLCTFWLRNVLRATTARAFSTSQLPKVVRAWCTFWLGNVLRTTTSCNLSSLVWPDGSAPAALASLLFDPSKPQIIAKTTVFRDFPTFSRICIFFLLTLSLLFLFSLLIFLFSLPLPCSAFHLSILSEVWLLNFLR